MNKTELEKIEIELFLESIYQRYGYDFKHYAKASIKRRIKNLQNKYQFENISDMIPKVLNDEAFFNNILFDFSITVTEMFRDPGFFKIIREKIVPYLKTYPFIKIWHAGCATGEEVYSLAIVLKEEGLYDRATIYATDFNNIALNKAKERIYPLDDIKQFTKNYQAAGGKYSFSDYYHAQYNSVILDKSLMKNITFANHNLVTDSVFSEMHLILCRNVLIYFNKDLQNKVLELFNESLIHNGFLALGSRESLRFSSIESDYKTIDKSFKIYQKS